MRIKDVMVMDGQFVDVYQDIKHDINVLLESVLVNQKQCENVLVIIDSILRRHLEINDETDCDNTIFKTNVD